MSAPLAVQLAVPKAVSPEALQALRAGVVAAIDAGATEVTIDVDDVGVLDSPLIAALISILREARERGATVSLLATRKSILETLHITALEKVFRVVSSGDQSALPPPARKAKSGRAAAAIAGALLVAGSVLCAPASGGQEPSPADVIANVVAQNAGMQSYRARVDIAVALRSFPYLSQRLQGTTYYKRPDNYEVVFDDVPSYARGFERIYTDIDDPIAWQRHFNASLAGERNVAGHRDLVLRLVQKVRGMIDHEDVAVDPASWHIDAMEWHYYNGGTISMTQEYQDVAGFSVLARQHATIRIPFVHAGADAVYGDYQTNVAIDDSVFVGKKN